MISLHDMYGPPAGSRRGESDGVCGLPECDAEPGEQVGARREASAGSFAEAAECGGEEGAGGGGLGLELKLECPAHGEPHEWATGYIELF